MPIKNDGLVRIHGPVNCRCPGSNHPPSSSSAPEVSASDSTLDPTPPSSSNPVDLSFKGPSGTKVIRRIPRGSRDLAARKFAYALDQVTSLNNVEAWLRLLQLPRKCFSVPRRCGKCWSLATIINRQIKDESDPPSYDRSPASGPDLHQAQPITSIHAIASRISCKLEEGDYKGALRLACSEDTFAPPNDSTIEALKSKHPPPHPESVIPTAPIAAESVLEVNQSEVIKALLSFPKGSAGGPECLRPQHLADMTSRSANDGGLQLLQALTSFVNFILSGMVHADIRPFFFGATLLGLKKKDGGIRPIAIGGTLRRLVAKVASRCVSAQMVDVLAPLQLGYASSKGAEAAVHSARMYLRDLPANYAMVKLDFRNAFNSVRRDRVLEAALEHIPELYPFVYCCYSTSSHLFFDKHILSSQEGVQQGDPLGPLLFCLAIHPLVKKLSSELKIFYLDDGLIGGSTSDVLEDIRLIQREAARIGLQLNLSKSELITHNSKDCSILQSADLISIHPEDATFLGAPIGPPASVDSSISIKISALKVMSERLPHLQRHDALLLLRHSLAIPKILYLLRTAPCFLSPMLEEFDYLLRSTLSAVLNINLSDDLVWLQSSLPVSHGGLGVRSAVQLAPSAYLASAAGCTSLTRRILPSHLCNLPLPEVSLALNHWSPDGALSPPASPDKSKQKAWDLPKVESSFDLLINNCQSPAARARLLGAASKESGAWLNAPPVSSLGLQMDNDCISICAGLRLGVPLCHPHLCHQCGSPVDEYALHGPSCVKSQGRHPRHNNLNEIIHSSLTAAGVPCQKEPHGLAHSDGKRPDDVTM